MGEIAEMMLDGTLCASCGVFLDSEPEGFAVYCARCAPDFDFEMPRPSKSGELPRRGTSKRARTCQECGKRLKTSHGLAQHILDVHGGED